MKKVTVRQCRAIHRSDLKSPYWSETPRPGCSQLEADIFTLEQGFLDGRRLDVCAHLTQRGTDCRRSLCGLLCTAERWTDQRRRSVGSARRGNALASCRHGGRRSTGSQRLKRSRCRRGDRSSDESAWTLMTGRIGGRRLGLLAGQRLFHGTCHRSASLGHGGRRRSLACRHSRLIALQRRKDRVIEFRFRYDET